MANPVGGSDRRGRHRDSQSHQAILAATLESLSELGYVGTTIEGVATRAGVGKATIYRWWTSKGALVGEALSSRLDEGPEPETGNLRDDLKRVIEVTVRNYTEPENAIALMAFAAHVERDESLLSTFREKFLASRRLHARQMLQRAIARGELPPDADLDLMMDLWAGTIFYRSQIVGSPPDPTLPDRLVDLFLSGAVPRLTPERRT
jgi:AcrR family transcriptional regulator